jgi:3-phytase
MSKLFSPGRVVLLAVVAVVLGWTARALWTTLESRSAAEQVTPAGETDQVLHSGDAADDPAIWVHPIDPLLSVVLGTDKKGGLGVYDLEGRELQYLEHGRINNVDLRAGVPFRGGRITLVAAGEKRHEQLLLYRLDPDTRLLERIPDADFNLGVDPEGVALYRSQPDGELYAFASGEDLRKENTFYVEQWRIFERGDEIPFGAERVRRLKIDSQTEGLVADDDLGDLYVAEENVGIWKFSASPEGGSTGLLIDRTGKGGHLVHDVEGLALYRRGDGTGYLIASSQGSDDFVVYRREGQNEYVGRFWIGAANGVDKVTHTDGIEVTSLPLGARFPAGIFVAQDDENDHGWQNFKLVSWQDIALQLERSS